MFFKNVFRAFLACASLLTIFPRTSFPDIDEQVKLKHDVAVTMKLVQVYVLGKDGRPVRDLEPGEFEVIVDRRIQTLAAFEMHVAPAEAGFRSQEETAGPTEVKLSRKFFFLFDFAFNDVGGIAMSKKTALDFLESQAGPTDEIGILSYSVEKGLTLHEYLSRDRAKIRETIETLGTAVGLGRAGTLWEELSTEKTAKMDRGASSVMAAASREEFKQAARAQYQTEILNFSSALKDFAAGLRYMPGIKHVVLFSKGPPDFLMYQRADQIAPTAGQMNLNASDGLNLRLRYEAMIRELSSANSPVISVNVEGLSARVRDMDFEELSRSARPSSSNPSGTAPDFIERAAVGDSSLTEIARLSGGKYFGGMNDYRKISKEIQALTGTFYVLGFMVPEISNGKFEEVEVRVKRRGCEVHAQKGYFNSKPFVKLSALEKRLQLIDLALNESPHFSAPIRFPLASAVRPDSGSENALMLLAGVPVLQLRSASGPSRYEVFLLLFDEEKNLAGQTRMELDAEKTADEATVCGAFAPVPAGQYEVRVVVRNTETGRGAVGSASVEVPRRDEPGFKLFPPLLFVPRERPAPILGSLPEAFDFNPALFRPLTSGMSAGTKTVSALLPCSFSQYEGGDLVLRVQAVGMESGVRTWLPLTVSTRRGVDAVTYRIDLETGGLVPGPYALYIFAEDAAKRHPTAFIRATLTVT